MRVNEPVTQREYDFPDNATLMSTTDTQSYIAYANAAFVDVSGFSREEIEGQPHNIVRHPDMPPEAFADMWATLKGGEPWSALVKNRRKNGDHYWVRANATPVVRNGRPAGYMSVRTKPTRDEVAAAEALYRDFRAGRAGSRTFHKGLIVRTGLMAWRSVFQVMPVRWRIRLAFMALLPLTLGAAWGAGLSGAALGGFAAAQAVALALGAGWLQAQIARPLEQTLQQALRVASGESQKAVLMDRVDEIGMTLRTISQLGLMFRWLIDDVSEQVLNVQAASQEIARDNNDINARTEQAASSVQQTSSSMTQMTATVASNAETAGEANQLSGAATEAAVSGGRAMAEVVATMESISQSASQIADIIGVIDSIAFQTNILALNAAVEAARAGEQGRGFAVVAGEVRALAQRSASAAREIKDLIGASVGKVASGSRLVDEAGKTMDDIVSQVKRVSGMIAEISLATAEQTDGILQVSQAVTHLDQITQENATLVEQSALAAESLRVQATRLVEAVGVFR
ncbi:methyl-accepting chemotaxis protein [Ralstonia pseudosolanacearum]|uniref:Fused signal transducer for aerotaxis sensory component methyl accepting chemotaxis component n=1 Tax=Ralstonia solanacearum TaxID=305 RepID=A0A0S4TNC8_RALSL|nr:PAS domain-containing methyl-accepting chemotaxis protein [Ralstonia pseudosolanacearum]OAI76303.1 aerotaxis receptor Aer [Ralstonia solanacearum]QCX51846.1 PAS domain-containing methyl-accepting chemotaxis protein [Ralstonia pseudosolanacearum]CUV11478.1 fused signal transducer for aerotaxis sensory component; methyl accepting chemotaxis component [Ralstonia solanacearum]